MKMIIFKKLGQLLNRTIVSLGIIGSKVYRESKWPLIKENKYPYNKIG